MQLHTQAWERPLLLRAFEATRECHLVPELDVGTYQLDCAYDYCDALTATHSRSFYLASRPLPLDKRRGVRALYAFCRVSDDIVDQCDRGENVLIKAERLSAWRERALAPQPRTDDLVALAWADTRRRFRIPQRYAEQLIDGVAQDLCPRRYATFAQLAEYSYGVASTVGLMSMHIVGYTSNEAVPYAIRLGVALQLTNILRDVGEDWRKRRVYLPMAELRDFGISNNDLAAGRVTAKWRAFMRFQIERNRRLYRDAMPGIGYLNPDGQFSIAAAAALYQGILGAIEANDYDVFRRKAHLTLGQKLVLLPIIWWRAKRTYGKAPP